MNNVSLSSYQQYKCTRGIRTKESLIESTKTSTKDESSGTYNNNFGNGASQHSKSVLSQGKHSFLPMSSSEQKLKAILRKSIEHTNKSMKINNNECVPLYKYCGGGTSLFAKSATVPEKHTSPAVGTYNLARLMDNNITSQLNDDKLSSSFLSSGRSKLLMNDALYYKTWIDEIEEPSRGPGIYDTLDSWTLSSRSNVNFVATHTGVIHNPNYDKAWRQKPQKNTKQKKVRSNIGINDDEADQSNEKALDVQSVRNLPSYM